MALTIDPDDVPRTLFAVIEDGDLDRWMAPGQIDVRNSDGSSTTYDLDNGSGGAFRIGTDLGVLFFRLDLSGGIATGVTGPTVDAALPADTSTEIHFEIATLASTSAGDFEQIHQGPLRWQNSGRPGTWGTAPIIFTKDDGSGGRLELGRISFDRGVPILTDAPLDIQLDSLGTPILHGVSSAVMFLSQDFTWDAFQNKWIGTTNADYKLVYSLVWELWGLAGFPIAYLDSSEPTGIYTATEYGEDTFNGGSPWTYTVSA